MKVVLITIALLFSATPAFAQQQSYAPPDAELWGLMMKAMSDIPMSMTAHQQVQQIMADVQREAQMRERIAKGAPPKDSPDQPK